MGLWWCLNKCCRLQCERLSATGVKEKIKKLKQMQKEHSVPKKKRKLDNPETKNKPETSVKNKKSVEASHVDKPKSKPKMSRMKLKKMMMERDIDNNGIY